MEIKVGKEMYNPILKSDKSRIETGPDVTQFRGEALKLEEYCKITLVYLPVSDI